MSATIPGSARIAAPGLVEVTPGNGLIKMWPFSVCHHVSTIGQLLPSMCSRYHIHASGLMGSPTLPNRRSDDKSCWAGMSRPHRMNVRILVGAQYRTVTPYFSTISHQRPRWGVSGVPSYKTDVVAFASGP